MAHIDWAKQEALNTEHLIRPQPGDYWSECFTPIRYVTWTDGEFVEFMDAQTHVMIHNGERCWDTDKPQTRTTIEEFAAYLKYNIGSMANKTWADVHPGAYPSLLHEALEKKRKRAP